MVTDINDVLRRLEALEAVVLRLVRVGVVTALYPERGTVRVQTPDVHAGGQALVSYELPVRFDKTCRDKQYHLPDVGEQVLCVFLPTGAEQGFVLGAIYSDADAVPVADADKRHLLFSDGSWFEYDRAEHKLSGHVVNGCAELTVDIDAAVTIGRDLTASVGRDATVDIAEDLTASVGKTAALSVTEDLSADVGGDATLTAAGEATVEGTEKATLTSGTEVQVVAPIIRLTGNITSGSSTGGTNIETKTTDVDHTGDVQQVGDYVLQGSLHVTNLTVDNPINGTLVES